MNMKHTIIGLAVALLAFGAAGCEEYGKVDQGRAIAYDKENHIVTIIQDKAMDPAKPDYSVLPPHTYKMPLDPAETGPEPKPGYRMKLDVDKKVIDLYNPSTQNFEELPIEIVDVQKGIAKDHPLVFDKDASAARKFPVIDKDKKSVTVYSGRQKMLVTFLVPDSHIDLPPMTWDSGDEVRLYYKTEGQALRFMNISKTDIFKK